MFSWATPLAWLHFEGNSLFIGQPDFIGQADASGIWKLPITEIEAAFAQQRQIALAAKAQQAAQAKAAVDQVKNELLAKYDRNHNGIIDPDEKEAAIADPQFLELNLPIIVTDTNGLLDAKALRFFDANNNGVLDSPEQNAIDTTISLLAKKLVAKSSPDADGRISPDTLPKELSAPSRPRPVGLPGFAGMNANAQKKIEEKDVETMMRAYLSRSFRIDGKAVVAAPTMVPGGTADPKAIIKARVEEYWRLSQP